MAECKNKRFFDAYFLDNYGQELQKKEPGHILQALVKSLYRLSVPGRIEDLLQS